MSYKYHANTNKQQNHSKGYRQYLYNSGEPIEDSHNISQSQLDAELLEDSFAMKTRFRYIAQKMRSQYR